jgi:hypothetical protein
MHIQVHALILCSLVTLSLPVLHRQSLSTLLKRSGPLMIGSSVTTHMLPGSLYYFISLALLQSWVVFYLHILSFSYLHLHFPR